MPNALQHLHFLFAILRAIRTHNSLCPRQRRSLIVYSSQNEQRNFNLPIVRLRSIGNSIAQGNVPLRRCPKDERADERMMERRRF